LKDPQINNRAILLLTQRSLYKNRTLTISSYQVTKDGIEGDLKTEKPQWPFSAYGPGRDAPIQLFGGFPLEQSPEEMRVLYYKALASGNPQSAVSDVDIDTPTWLSDYLHRSKPSRSLSRRQHNK
jgi:hypothetical protein